MRKILSSAIIITALVAGSASGALIIEETFNYASGTVLSSAQTGGTGFSGGYYANDALTTSPSSVEVATTGFNANMSGITSQIGVSFNDIGTTGGTAHRALGTGASINNNPGTDQSLYVSFTYRSDGSTGGARIGFGRDDNETLEFRQVGGGQLTAYWSQAGGSTLGNSVQTASALGPSWNFVVARLDFSATAGQDRIRFSVFEGTDTVADNAWEVDSGGFTMQGGTLDQFYKDAGGSNTRFGNIRVGETFADVVPEPATVGMLGLGALVALGVRRLRS